MRTSLKITSNLYVGYTYSEVVKKWSIYQICKKLMQEETFDTANIYSDVVAEIGIKAI